MVLCVFEIEDPSPKTPEGTLPNLVLTDGWYRIRARIDLTLATAVKNHKIRVGTKLEIIGAKVRF
jgi:breast cancer 2 susceptibility protein